MHMVRDMNLLQPYYTTWFSGYVDSTSMHAHARMPTTILSHSLLKPFVNYMPVTAEMLPVAVKHCLKHDRECRKIADNAFSLATCELSLATQTRYVTKVLELVQQVQLSVLDPSVMAASAMAAH